MVWSFEVGIHSSAHCETIVKKKYMICLSGSSKDCVINLPNMKTPLAIFFFLFSDNIFSFLLYQGNNIQDIFFPGHDSLWIIYWFQNTSSKITSDIGDIYTVCEYCSQITIACLKWWQIMFVIFWQPFYASDKDSRKFLMEATKVFSISIAINDVRCQNSRSIFWCCW